jgi:hypothetical protein
MSLTKYKDGICMPALLFVPFSLFFLFLTTWLRKRKIRMGKLFNENKIQLVGEGV